MASDRFAYCYPAGDVIWCMHHNGSWAPPFPIAEADSLGLQVQEDDTNNVVSSEEDDAVVE